MLLTSIAQLARAVVGARLEHHRDADVLAVQRVLERERADVERRLEALDDRVDVAGVDLHAALVDLLALAAAQVQPAALVDQADVAGEEPAVAHDLRRSDRRGRDSRCISAGVLTHT